MKISRCSKAYISNFQANKLLYKKNRKKIMKNEKKKMNLVKKMTDIYTGFWKIRHVL